MAGRKDGAAPPRGSGARGGPTFKGGGTGSAGCLIWLVVFSFIFLLFILNWGKISDTLQRTNFSAILKSQKQDDKGAPTAPVKPAPKVEAPLVATQPAPGAATAGTKAGAGPSTQAQGRGGEAIDIAPEGSAKPVPAGAASPSAAAERALTNSPPTRSRSATLYFVKIDDDGVIVRQDVSRFIPASDSPLSDALIALVRGPNEEELRKHLVSLIPAGTKLLSVRMQGSTAVVNLGEAFMYNHYGIEGYAGQLKQIVYTATAFPTVHDVQILIDGERHDYLGGEGVYIGKPLSRNSF